MGVRLMTDNALETVRTTGAHDLAPRPAELDGQRLGVLDTGFGSSAQFLDLLRVRLEKRHFLSAVVRMAKPSQDQACPTDLLEQLAEQCDVVVTGVSGSVGTAVSAAVDVIALERLSVACALIVTAEVRSEVQQSLAAQGYEASRSIVVLPRSLHAGRNAAQALVEVSFRAVERVLTTGASAPGPVEPRRPAQRNGEVSCEC